MKRKIIGSLIIIGTFVLGYSLNNIAISSSHSDYRIAVINIPQIIANSEEIKILKAEQEKSLSTMQDTIEKAKLEISKETNPQKAMQLEEKYGNEINKQKLARDKSYNQKLLAIDNKIKTAVVENAHSMHYNIVLPKNIVLFGGDDITDAVATMIK